jgi:hypothetical protein
MHKLQYKRTFHEILLEEEKINAKKIYKCCCRNGSLTYENFESIDQVSMTIV